MLKTARSPLAALTVGLILSWSVQATGLAKDSADSKESPQKSPTETAAKDVTQGALRIVGKDGSIVECPLKHTDVKADVSGFVARVRVTQTFHNPTDETIEAVYVFPLPHEAAVDDMTMVIGERKIVGLIKRRHEARRIYEEALSQGRTAALLEQERPNIFTQSVGNIAADQEIKIEISYVDVLKYDLGAYEFHFPMVVGPRFIPGAPIDSPPPTPPSQQGKVSPPTPNTDRVPDASRISPPVLRPEVRNGHDISLAMTLDAGVPVHNLAVANHKASIEQSGNRKAKIKLDASDSIPNKDFVVRYGVAGKQPEMAVLAHTGDYSPDAQKLGNGYFMLMIQPQENQQRKKSPPREIVFLVDVSGSMRGAKTDKVREAMQSMLGLCRKKDTVQVITFASQAQKLFDKPLPVDQASIQQALNFTNSLKGSGGTRMLQGVKLAIDEPVDSERLRVVVMLTDGFIGNESEIIQHVGKKCGDQIRFWAIGIGQSPNMFLVDGVARQGGGMGKRLGLKDEAESLSHEVITRIQRAQLANVKIGWGDMQVSEVYPARIPELWAGRPVILFGRYKEGGRHGITVSGTVEGESVSWPLTVELPAKQADHDVLAKVWARRQIEDLMQQDFFSNSPAIEETVTALALRYKLMSRYTSFVAVDEKDANQVSPARPPRRMTVPVPLPEGAQWEGFFGGESAYDSLVDNEARKVRHLSKLSSGLAAPMHVVGGAGFGLAGGISGGGFGGGRGRPALALSLTQPLNRSRGGRLGGNQTTSFMTRFGRPTNSIPTQRYTTATLARRGSRTVTRNARGLGLADAYYYQPQPVQLTNGVVVAGQVLQEHARSLGELAQVAVKTLPAEPAKIDDEAARFTLLQACFLDRAAANRGASAGQISHQALGQLSDLHDRQVEAWVKKLPKLEQRLKLVIRDRTFAEALQDLEQASGLDIKLLDGSVADVAEMTANEGRVGYLDLRGATVAQALDWLLVPSRLNWRLQGQQIVAGSARRLPGRSAWVYDVSSIALPTKEELGKDAKKAIAAAKKLTDDFLSTIQSAVKDDDKKGVVWFAAGQLLVFGDPERHAQVAKIVDDLGGTTKVVQLTGELGKLQAATLKRVKEFQQDRDSLRSVVRKARIAHIHQTYGWKLLAAAARGELDDESVTWLQIAWAHPANQEMLSSTERALPLRTLWLLAEASRALPDEEKLTELARLARKNSEAAIQAAVAEVAKSPDDVQVFAAMLYASLASRDDKPFVELALKQLAGKDAKVAQLKQSVLLLRSLLVDREQIDSNALTELVRSGVNGGDLVALTALACRRADGVAWTTFREQMRDMVGGQAIPGSIVVLLHHLPENRLAVTQ